MFLRRINKIKLKVFARSYVCIWYVCIWGRTVDNILLLVPLYFQGNSGVSVMKLHVIQSFLQLLQTTLSFMLMLVVMTYNVWLVLSVILGDFIGYIMFAGDSTQSSNDHCGWWSCDGTLNRWLAAGFVFPGTSSVIGSLRHVLRNKTIDWQIRIGKTCYIIWCLYQHFRLFSIYE